MNFLNLKENQRIVLMTTKASISYTKFKFKENDTILFGRESAGVPERIHKLIKNRLKIPMKNNKRSLNLATAVAIVLAESLKQTKFFNMNLEIKRDLVSNWFKTLQNAFCEDIVKIENNKSKFISTSWKRN